MEIIPLLRGSDPACLGIGHQHATSHSGGLRWRCIEMGDHGGKAARLKQCIGIYRHDQIVRGKRQRMVQGASLTAIARHPLNLQRGARIALKHVLAALGNLDGSVLRPVVDNDDF